VDIFITPPHPCSAAAHQADSGSAVAPIANLGINSGIMFERYTEKARRVIFFARYEASQYGSAYIDTEHILLGLLREDIALMHRYAGPIQSSTEIRTEVERSINRGTPIATSVEVPLSGESKKLLNFAGEEADRLAHRHIGTEHILLGIFRLPDSLAAKVLLARGAKPNAIREQLAKGFAAAVVGIRPAQTRIDAFLALLKRGASDELTGYFDEKGQFVDSSGKRWIGRAEIEKGAETLLAPFAKRNASFRIEDTTAGPSHIFVASVLWEFAAASVDRSKSVLCMSIVLAWADEAWAIVLLQVTPVALS
jgi:Clp amino terminal domain, pathogenicity island component